MTAENYLDPARHRDREIVYSQAGPLEVPAAPNTAVGILGTGSYLPHRVVSNAEIAANTETTEEWIVAKTEIRRRRYAAPEEATSDLAARAARAALVDAGVGVEQLDYIIVATSTPDHPQPATAALVQGLLGADGTAAFDVNAVCSGFVFAMHTAARLLARGGHGLVIGADIYSRIVDPTDRRTAALFGDGAGAVVLGPVRAPAGLLSTVLHTYGGTHETIRVPAGGSRLPARELGRDDKGHYFSMQGRAVREFVATHMPLSIKEVLRTAGLTETAVDHFIPHQANGVMLRELAPTLGLDNAEHHVIVSDCGNTGAASVPVTLDRVHREGALQNGDLVLLSAFGGGMSIANTLLRWGR
ncbi:3-oxoacyl-ACP synthase III family protein [Nocardia alba]|uniref:3-oxoacyl-[acyl-carrier-protein] synthase-3 n=1 Tax=Nocardia alba TaxID=225051 RepID=A0A4R1FAQ5_9NOCA|nr:ketoacyl-ACP synthase III [Nocardia alba]TCJ89872.1 3-oxoacyl-[acyl-carrier-protein] synthase-3 [Nocardia alba]